MDEIINFTPESVQKLEDYLLEKFPSNHAQGNSKYGIPYEGSLFCDKYGNILDEKEQIERAKKLIARLDKTFNKIWDDEREYNTNENGGYAVVGTKNPSLNRIIETAKDSNGILTDDKKTLCRVIDSLAREINKDFNHYNKTGLGIIRENTNYIFKLRSDSTSKLFRNPVRNATYLFGGALALAAGFTALSASTAVIAVEYGFRTLFSSFGFLGFGVLKLSENLERTSFFRKYSNCEFQIQEAKNKARNLSGVAFTYPRGLICVRAAKSAFGITTSSKKDGKDGEESDSSQSDKYLLSSSQSNKPLTLQEVQTRFDDLNERYKIANRENNHVEIENLNIERFNLNQLREKLLSEQQPKKEITKRTQSMPVIRHTALPQHSLTQTRSFDATRDQKPKIFLNRDVEKLLIERIKSERIKSYIFLNEIKNLNLNDEQKNEIIDKLKEIIFGESSVNAQTPDANTTNYRIAEIHNSISNFSSTSDVGKIKFINFLKIILNEFDENLDDPTPEFKILGRRGSNFVFGDFLSGKIEELKIRAKELLENLDEDDEEKREKIKKIYTGFKYKNIEKPNPFNFLIEEAKKITKDQYDEFKSNFYIEIAKMSDKYIPSSSPEVILGSTLQNVKRR
jgi:hypothetical protein